MSVHRREEFLDITMQLIAEEGFGGFSMQQVTRKMGVSEALIYKYFGSKENLLFACFEQMHISIASLFKGFQLPKLETLADFYNVAHSLWNMYFDFLVSCGHKTVYYFDYRDSPYIKTIMLNDDKARNTYFRDFGEIMHNLNSRYHFVEKIESAPLWTCILDTTGLFAKRVIRGELPRTQEGYEQIWRLISGGFLSSVN